MSTSSRSRVPTWLLIVLVTVVLVAAPSGIVWAGYLSSTAAPVVAPPRQASHPAEIGIDSLGLRHVGILPMAMKDGALTPPDNPRLVGWWNHSADVGASTGTTLLTAHKVHNGSGVFEHLVDIKPGAEIVITGDKGSYVYVVQDVRVLNKDQLAAESAQLFAQDGPHRLVLVTCEDWDGKEFAANSVVVAVPKADPAAT